MGLIQGYKQLLAHKKARRELDELTKRAYKRAQDKSPRFIGVVPASGGALLWKIPGNNVRNCPWTYYLDRGKGWRRIMFDAGEHLEREITTADWVQHEIERWTKRRRLLLEGWAVLSVVCTAIYFLFIR